MSHFLPFRFWVIYLAFIFSLVGAGAILFMVLASFGPGWLIFGVIGFVVVLGTFFPQKAAHLSPHTANILFVKAFHVQGRSLEWRLEVVHLQSLFMRTVLFRAVCVEGARRKVLKVDFLRPPFRLEEKGHSLVLYSGKKVFTFDLNPSTIASISP